MSTFQAITYNVIQSLIAVNAIDSERRDQDYFFHPSQATLLRSVIVNLSQSCFWSMDRTELEEQMETHVKHAKNSVETAIKRGASEEDVHLVREAHRIL